MRVRYIFHSGFLVETKESYYLFDYWQGPLPTLAPDKPVTVFASHAHHDHYAPEVFSNLRHAGAKDVYAVLSKDIPTKKHPPHVPVCRAYAGSIYPLPHGGQVETLRSTDSGVAYLATCHEGVIYHAGDLNDWTWEGEPEAVNRQMRDNYRRQIDKLKGREIDLAFVPLDPRQGAHYAHGLLYFLETTKTKAVYPMHYWKQPEVIERFLRQYPQYRGVVQCAQ